MACYSNGFQDCRTGSVARTRGIVCGLACFFIALRCQGGLADEPQPRPLRELPISGEALRPSFSPDSKTLAIGSNEEGARGIRLWDMSTGKERKLLSLPPDLVGFAYSPDGKTIAVGVGGVKLKGRPRMEITLRDSESGDVLKTFTQSDCYLQWPNPVGFSPDGKTLAAYCQFQLPDPLENWHHHSRILLLDADSWKVRAEIIAPAGHWGGMNSPFGNPVFSFSPDSQAIALAEHPVALGPYKWENEHWVELRETATGEVTSFLKGLKDSHKSIDTLRSVAFSPDRKTLASASEDGKVGIWYLSTGELIKVLDLKKEVKAKLITLCYSADGRYLAAVCRGRLSNSEPVMGRVLIWDTQTFDLRANFVAHETIWDVAFSPDGKMLATSGYTRRQAVVKLWKVSDVIGSKAEQTKTER